MAADTTCRSPRTRDVYKRQLYFYGEAGAQTLAFAQMRNRDLQQAAADSCADRALPPRSDKRQTKL